MSRVFHAIGAVFKLSTIKKGSRISVPETNDTNKKFTGDISAGFLLTSTLYIAKDNAANKIQMSPTENLKANNVATLPFDNKTSIPAIDSIRPTTLSGRMLSFNKNTEIRIAKMGDEVVPINDILIAVVYRPAT